MLLNALDLFSGAGGGACALAPWMRPIAYCEINEYARGILLSRMASGEIPIAPIHCDVRQLRGGDLPHIDAIYGGAPCQDLSGASHGRGAGLAGKRSGLWYEMLRLLEECRPGIVFIENVDGSAWRKWLPHVRRDLWSIGYTSLSLRVRAYDVGAPFQGSRIFVAATDCYGKPAFPLNAEVAFMPPSPGLGWVDWGQPPSDALGVADGIPAGMDRRRAMGNAWVPAQAQEAFRRLMRVNEMSIPINPK